jgi:anti-anti-sigma regulatory factor
MTSSVRATTEHGYVTIALEGHLDASTGHALLRTLESELVHEPARVDIDLSVLESFASDGAIALSRCRDLCRQLPDGLHYRTEGGAGQLALLTAFEREPEVDSIG